MEGYFLGLGNTSMRVIRERQQAEIETEKRSSI